MTSLFVCSFVNLSGTDCQLNIVEFLEHHFAGGGSDVALSPYPLTHSNIPGYSDDNAANMASFMGAAEKVLSDVRCSVPSKARLHCRFNAFPAALSYQDVVTMAEEVQADLGLSFFACAVNFWFLANTQVVLAVAKSLADLSTPESRRTCLTMPPGPPPPIGAPVHVASMVDSIFYNDYGLQNPRISSRVSDFFWDWTGIGPEFNPVFAVVSGSGRLFVGFTTPAHMWQMVEKRFSLLGPPLPLRLRELSITSRWEGWANFRRPRVVRSLLLSSVRCRLYYRCCQGGETP
mmetsp:Transcript_35022/g.91681  ORF Transcript_35022/g.91681 Transcript_35022/m.91681 type:complete len:290 (+) Transcript_35022:299-1168(+)